MVKLKVFGLYL